MGIFNFFKKKPIEIIEERTDFTEDGIEFLITGDIDVFDKWDDVMTPNSISWKKVSENNWDYYYVGDDKYYYSIEPPGIQMVFNKEITYKKAKTIAQEIIENILKTGQTPELIEIKNTVYKF